MNSVQKRHTLKCINNKYNFLRYILFDLIYHYISIKKYHTIYISFLSYIKKKYHRLYKIAQTKRKAFTISKYKNYKTTIRKIKKKLSSDVIIMLGKPTKQKYKAIKYIMNKILNYHKHIYNTLLYMETHIIRIVNGMNKFYMIYSNIMKNNDNNTFHLEQLILSTVNALQYKNNVNYYLLYDST